MNLYEMTKEWENVFDMLDDPEVPDDAVFDTIEMIEADMDIKAENYAKMIRSLDDDVSKIDQEIKRLRERKVSMNNRITAMKARLMDTMRTTGRLKFKTPLFSFSIRRNGGYTPVIITGEVPDQWRKPGDPDTNAIRKELESGEFLPFAQLGERGESLVIR